MNQNFISNLYITLTAIILALILVKDLGPINSTSAELIAKKMAPHDHFDIMRSYPELTPGYDGIDQGLKTAYMMSQSAIRSNGFDQEWLTEGPANIGARINTIAVPKGRKDTIYIGYSRGGIYRTFDGGSFLAIFV